MSAFEQGPCPARWPSSPRYCGASWRRAPPAIRRTAGLIAAQEPRFVLLTARGSSGHAALYAKCPLEIRLGLPCGSSPAAGP